MALAWCCFVPGAVLGAGFALIQQGVGAMGQGNAFVAEANDATAIFYNPAGLNQLPRAQFYQGTTFNHPDREFHGADQFSETNHRWYRNLQVYFALPLHERIAVGIGFFSPFGMGTAWPPTWAGRYLTTSSSLVTYNLNPVVSVRVWDKLSLAAGLDVMWSGVDLKRKAPVVIPTRRGPVQLPDAETWLTGDGSGVGYNLALHYEPVTDVKLGVSYRSAIFVKYLGELSIFLPSPLQNNSPTAGKANLTFPPSVTFGVAYGRLKPLTLEFDTTWTGWSTYDQLRVNVDSPITVNGVLTETVASPKKWHDAWAFRFGANYQLTEAMKIRAGYIYDLTPVPDETFDPQVPDANRHIFTVGGELKYKRFTLGIAYNYILSESRNKDNLITFNGVPAPLQANGRYNSDVHSVALGWTFQF